MNMKKMPIGEIATIVMGQSPPGNTYNEIGEGLPLLNGPTEFGINFPECTLFTTDTKRQSEIGDLIFCVRGSTTGRMNWADQIYSLGRGVCGIRGKNILETKYVKYCIDNYLSGLLQFAGGGTFPNLSKNDIAEFKIPYSGKTEKIAFILSTYDDLIENNLKRIKLLEEAGRLNYKYLQSDLKSSKFDRVKLVDILDLKYGKALKSDNRLEGKYPVYGSSGIVGTHQSYLSTSPGIIVGRKGNVGSIFWAFENFWVIDTAYYVESTLSFYFLYYNLLEQHFENTDAAVPGLNRKFALDNFIDVPPQKDLIEFEATVKIYFELIHNLLIQNQNLREARNILLPRLMSGEIEV